MNIPVKLLVKIAGLCLLCTSVTTETAWSQTAAASGMLAQGSNCLAIEGKSSAQKTPKVGTRVVVKTCNGLPSQQWTVLMGDYDHILFRDSSLRLSTDEKDESGVSLMLDKSSRLGWQYSRKSWSWIRDRGARCLTLVEKNNLALQPCSDDDKRQRWSLR